MITAVTTAIVCFFLLNKPAIIYFILIKIEMNIVFSLLHPVDEYPVSVKSASITDFLFNHNGSGKSWFYTFIGLSG